MESETPKKDIPVCACGKADLYVEYMKLNGSNTSEVTDSQVENQVQNKHTFAIADSKPGQ